MLRSFGGIREGITNHLANRADQRIEIDQKTCGRRSSRVATRNSGQVEAFLDAIQGCLRSDNSGSNITDIRELLSGEDEDDQLLQRIVQLFASCDDADAMDMTARRQRAITCARAIWEISNALMSERAPGDYCYARRNSRRVRPTSLCYYVAQPDAFQYSDVHLTVMTEFITGVLPLIPNLTGPSRKDLDVAKKTLGELCRCLDNKKFSDSAEQNFVEALKYTRRGHLSRAVINSTGKHRH